MAGTLFSNEQMVSIKEIARLSNVSTTTVSKIINNKSDDISQETIDKVLKIVKQYNYTPYGLTRSNSAQKTFTIGLLLKKMYNSNLFINGLIEVLNQSGYTLMLLDSNDSLENEAKNLSRISLKNLDGLIWEPVCEESFANLDILKNCNTKIIYIDSRGHQNNHYHIDYQKIGYFATSALIEKNHTKIGCVVRKGSHRSEEVAAGFKQCLFDNNISFSPKSVFSLDELQPGLFQTEAFTALISSHFATTQELTVLLEQMNISVPYDLSLLSLRDDVRDGYNTADLSTIKIPHYEFGTYIGNKIISLCEAKEVDTAQNFHFVPSIESSKSIDIPRDMRRPKITVVGSINMDNTIFLNQFPSPGITSYAREAVSLPGGKALNQAIGAAMQKKEVTLIGKIGKDSAGSVICKTLADHGIETASLISDIRTETGKAFILVEKGGDSIITVLEGANSSLTPGDITSRSKYFENTGICLLQTEIPIASVREAARIAKFYQATTILKPASIDAMADQDFENIDIFVPNQKESLRLSKKENVEDAAAYFLSKGVKTVIITLDKNGALVRTESTLKYYDAPSVDVIDATGGSDAFISTLGVKLLDNLDLDEAIQAATIAAGFCISKFGVSNSMIDNATLDSCINQQK